MFFLLQGVLMPNYDDIHYMFLTQTVGMPLHTYDFLNSLTYVSLITFIILFNIFFIRAQVWILILISLSLFLLMTSLMLINAVRMNVDWGISDEVFNSFIFGLNKLTNVILNDNRIRL